MLELTERVLNKQLMTKIKNQNRNITKGSERIQDYDFKKFFKFSFKKALEEFNLETTGEFYDMFPNSQVARIKFGLNTNNTNYDFIERLTDVILHQLKIDGLNIAYYQAMFNQERDEVNIILWI